MAAKFHDNVFDSGTLLKLELFERYLTSWLPVFVHRPGQINVFDFFSGPGGDSVGQAGSPIRVASVVRSYEDFIVKNNIKVTAFFNDKEKVHVDELQCLMDEVCPPFLNVRYDQGDYLAAFNKYVDQMQQPDAANFLFIDPCGIVKPDFFRTLSRINKTDFLLFLPIEFITRFKKQSEFKNKWPGIDRLDETRPKKATKRFCEELIKPLMPPNYHLAYFSIQKEVGTTHSLVFGSNNILGLDKFIHQCWKLDPENGEANFSLDGDLPSAGLLALCDISTGSKLRTYESFIEAEILSGRIQTNEVLYYTTLQKACLPKHARKVLAKLKKKNKIRESPKVSYDAIVKNKQVEPIRLVK